MRLSIGEFEIKDKDLAARIGRLRTPSGIIETPALFPVIDPTRQQPSVREIEELGFSQIITNAYLLWRRSGRKSPGDIHEVIGFTKTIMTDSGAYQILQYGDIEADPITIVEFQKEIGSDIAVILDYPTGNARTREQAEYSVEETLRRAKLSLDHIDPEKRVWVLPIQGGEFLDLVERSAKEASRIKEYAMYALGSPTVHMERYNYSVLLDMIYTAKSNLPLTKPLHLFGAGHPMIIPFAVALGVDTFDSASYILYARDDRYMTETRTYRLQDIDYFPCNCPVCSKYTPQELLELPKPERTRLLAIHNLHVLRKTILEVKLAIREGRLWELLEERSRAHPLLYSGFQQFRKYAKLLEELSPSLKGGEVHGLFFFNEEGLWRPQVLAHQRRILENYVPPTQASRLILLPASTRIKPLTHSPLYRNYRGGSGEDTHIVFYVPFLAVIPEELAETYPLTHYEHPDNMSHEVLEETVKRITEYIRKNMERYTTITIIVDSRAEWTLEIARKLEQILPKEKTNIQVHSSNNSPERNTSSA